MAGRVQAGAAVSGDRQLVREAIAAYFGGSPGNAAEGNFYQEGPLGGLCLGTAYPYSPKGVPDAFYTAGQPAGAAFGAVLSVRLGESPITRAAMGGKTSGWRRRHYQVTCALEAISYQPLLESAESALDDLIDGLLNMIYADRTLGSTNPALYPNPPYFGGRLITQAGEGSEGIVPGDPGWTPEGTGDRARFRGGINITFYADTYVQA
jgi:hypothetical protein